MPVKNAIRIRVRIVSVDWPSDQVVSNALEILGTSAAASLAGPALPIVNGAPPAASSPEAVFRGGEQPAATLVMLERTGRKANLAKCAARP